MTLVALTDVSGARNSTFWPIFGLDGFDDSMHICDENIRMRMLGDNETL